MGDAAHILLAKIGRDGPTHGYGLRELLKELSLDPSGVYKTLARLREFGLVEEAGEATIAGGRVRVPYRVTERGEQRIDAWMRSPLDPDELGADLLVRMRVAQPHQLPQLLDIAEQQLVDCSTRLLGRNGSAGALVNSKGCSWDDELALLDEERQTAALQGYQSWLRRACRSLEKRCATAGP